MYLLRGLFLVLIILQSLIYVSCAPKKSSNRKNNKDSQTKDARDKASMEKLQKELRESRAEDVKKIIKKLETEISEIVDRDISIEGKINVVSPETEVKDDLSSINRSEEKDYSLTERSKGSDSDGMDISKKGVQRKKTILDKVLSVEKNLEEFNFHFYNDGIIINEFNLDIIISMNKMLKKYHDEIKIILKSKIDGNIKSKYENKDRILYQHLSSRKEFYTKAKNLLELVQSSEKELDIKLKFFYLVEYQGIYVPSYYIVGNQSFLHSKGEIGKLIKYRNNLMLIKELINEVKSKFISYKGWMGDITNYYKILGVYFSVIQHVQDEDLVKYHTLLEHLNLLDSKSHAHFFTTAFTESKSKLRISLIEDEYLKENLDNDEVYEKSYGYIFNAYISLNEVIPILEKQAEASQGFEQKYVNEYIAELKILKKATVEKFPSLGDNGIELNH